MKINIFGVGRSGTKAVQLYISYLLAKRYGKVCLNYEPFQYKDRKLGKFGRGVKQHRRIPLLLNDSYSDRKLERFCSDLVNKNEVVVSKFIRANGRINFINRHTEADFSFLVIRNIYDVLKSLALANWSFIDKFDWEKLLKEANGIYPNEIKNINYYSDKLYVVAVYWYVMNKFALENAKDIIVIDYNNLIRLEEFCNKNILGSEMKINSELFQGNKIHDDSLIEDLHKQRISLNKQNENKIFSRLFKLIKQEFLSDFLNEKMGSLISINNSSFKTTSEKSRSDINNSSKTKIQIPPQPLLDDSQSEINQLLSDHKR